jgi:seryl-tRNA synthetase
MGKLAIFLFLVIASAAGGGAYYFKVEEQRTDLHEKTQSLSDIKEEHDRRASQLIPKKQENQDLQAKIDQLNDLTAESESLTSQAQALEKSLADLKREFIQTVIQVREASIGMTWPDIKVSDGHVLTSVRIQKITETDVTLSNSLGTFRLAAANLPADMRDRFRIDASPMTDSAALLASGLTVASQPEGATPSAEAPLSAAMLAKVSESEATLRKHLANQTELQRTRQAYLSQAQDYRKKDETARFLGKPMKYQSVIPKIIQAINQLDTQLAEISTKIVTLQMQVDNIKEGTGKEPVAAPDLPR